MTVFESFRLIYAIARPIYYSRCDHDAKLSHFGLFTSRTSQIGVAPMEASRNLPTRHVFDDISDIKKKLIVGKGLH